MIEKFSFGRNWQVFLKSMTEKNCLYAEYALKSFLRMKNLEGKSFLDIGCGSGIYSLAAYRLGAKKVVSFDIDSFSVQCSKHLKKLAGNPKNWVVLQGSVLDKKFVKSLGRFDIVYSWGVLHHTGNMWQAMKYSADRTKNNGYYYIAVYNKVKGTFGSNFWLKVKQSYNRSHILIKRVMELLYVTAYFTANLLKMQNPFRRINDFYKHYRGMSWLTNIRDWLGGLPYEFATADEVLNFMKENFPEFDMVKMETTTTIGNNSFLFQKRQKFSGHRHLNK